MGDKTYDVIVVGAGPGGSACAALLAKAGVKTLLLEKNDRAGGKALTMSREGFRYELWPVSGGPAHSSRFEQLIGELELDTELLMPEGAAVLLYRDPSGQYVPFQPPGPVPLKPEEAEEVNRFFTEIVSFSPQEIEALDEITFHEFASRYRIPQSFYSFLAMEANIVFVVPIDLLAASEAVRTLQDFARGGAACYFKGGYGRLFETCADAAKRYGGEVRLRTRVERITIEDGQVRGVVTREGDFQAPIVISNAGIQPTVLKLVGEEHFDKGYVNYVKELVPSLGLMGIRYFLSKPVLESGMYVTFSDDNYFNVERAERSKDGQLPEDVLVFVTVPSLYDPSLAPAGKQCALASTLCPPGADMKDPQVFWDKLDETVAKIWPELPKHVEHKEHYSTADVSSVTRDHVLPGQGGECIGLGQIVGQCGRYKPSARAPIRGLFYVGCDAGGYGCGTHEGVDSAFKVAHLVLQYHQMHRAI